MNVEEYISSGILEAYALGELSDRERKEVETNLQQYPALRKELALIEETQEQLFMKAAIKPSAAAKTTLFATLDTREGASKVVAINTKRSGVSFWKYAAAAAVTIALVSSYLAFNYWTKWKATENSLSDLIAQNQRVAQDYNTVNERLDQIEKDLNIINNPAFNRVVMKGTANAPGSIASVYWNEATREVYLSIKGMKELAQENQYQLWAIIDEKPVDAGVFDANYTGLLKMKEVLSGAAAFAVTIEPRGRQIESHNGNHASYWECYQGLKPNLQFFCLSHNFLQAITFRMRSYILQS